MRVSYKNPCTYSTYSAKTFTVDPATQWTDGWLPRILLSNGPTDSCCRSCYQMGRRIAAADSATQWADVDPAESKGKHGVWDPRPEFSITSPYVHSRVDFNTCTMGIGQPYARVDFIPQSVDTHTLCGFNRLSRKFRNKII